MFQNHMLGMLSLVAMEAPVSFDAEPIRDEKVKLLRSIRPIEHMLRAQYAASDNMPGYLQEEGIRPDSQTETFVAAKLFVDNMRWKGVPFYLRTGKRLAKRVTEIAIVFKQVPHSMFASVGMDDMPANMLVFNIQPDEGIDLSFQAKRPGSKLCMSTLTMDLNYAEVFGTSVPDAYQRLLLDSMVGDQTLFTRQDDVEVSWDLMMPILKAWQAGQGQLYKYSAGAETFPQADEIIASDDRKWRQLSEM
jgi:glucose-6-phosphate 1-dehydrogenase